MARNGIGKPMTGVVVDESGCEVDDLVFCGAVGVSAGADEEWDALVSRSVASGWAGMEALSGIPGTVGQVTRRNAAAFGQTVADTVVSVRTWDHSVDAQRTFASTECAFGPGRSRFSELLADGSERYLLLGVSFLLKQADLTAPVRDDALAALLGVSPGARVPLALVRAAVVRG